MTFEHQSANHWGPFLEWAINRPTGVRHRRQSLDGHGFNGFHVPVFCRWLDIHKEANPEFDNPDPTPDPSTLEALEVLIQKTYAAGGIVHLW